MQQSTSASKLVALGIGELFDLAKSQVGPAEEAVEAKVLLGVRHKLDHLLPGAVKTSIKNGWSFTAQGDPLNDFNGDIPSKWADDFLYLFGKPLPGKFTDAIRDALSPQITPGIRARMTPQTTHQQLGEMVADALYANAEQAIHAAAQAAVQAAVNAASGAIGTAIADLAGAPA